MAPGPTWGPQAQTKDSLPATEEVGQGGSEPTRHPSESPPLRALEVNPSAEGRRRGGGAVVLGRLLSTQCSFSGVCFVGPKPLELFVSGWC